MIVAPEVSVEQHPDSVLPEGIDPSAINREVEALPRSQILVESGLWRVYEAGAAQIPCMLREIGRLREIAFRAAGEGTGHDIDLDQFDADYRHLFIWDTAEHKVIGAYRLALTDDLLSRGINALYASTLFAFSPEFFTMSGRAVELGRSFIRTECQRSYQYLLLLWKGIGAYLQRHRACRSLYGAVSISRSYSDASRMLICAYLSRRHFRADLARWVEPRRPLRRPLRLRCEMESLAETLQNIEELSTRVADLEADGKGLPVLLKQYLRLGGEAVAFNVDPQFNDALDVLIVLDLARAADSFVRRCAPRLRGATAAQNDRV